jgi:hypothetical protein
MCDSIPPQVLMKETWHQYEIITRIDVIFKLLNRWMIFKLARNDVMIFDETSNIHTNLKVSSEY